MGKKKKKGKARVLRVFELWEWKGSASKEAVRSHKSHIGLRWILGPWVPKKISSLYPLPPSTNFLRLWRSQSGIKYRVCLQLTQRRIKICAAKSSLFQLKRSYCRASDASQHHPGRSWPSTLAPRRESRDVQVASDQEAVGLPLGKEFPGSY